MEFSEFVTIVENALKAEGFEVSHLTESSEFDEESVVRSDEWVDMEAKKDDQSFSIDLGTLDYPKRVGDPR